jgi:opacity protein-like surface antigen
MLKATLLTAFTFLALALQAQLAIGPKVNLGMTMFRPNDAAEEFREGRIGFSYSAGAQIDWRFGNLGIQPELLYTQRTISSEIEQAPTNGGGIADVDSKIKANSIDIPLLLKYYFRGKDIGGYVIAGPQLNFNIGGSITRDYYLNGELSETNSFSGDLEIGNSRSDFYNSSDFGFTFGGGVFVNMLTGKLNIDLRYRLGTTEQLSSGDPLINSRANFKSSDVMISAAYIFPLGGRW